jgi:predicted nucleotidyltransferase
MYASRIEKREQADVATRFRWADTPRMSAENQRLIDSLTRCLGARPEILEAYLFGSQARQGGQPHSDVDVAVCLDPDGRADSLFGYAAELTAELVALLKINDVDVVVLNQAPPLLYHRVLRDGVRLCTRDAAATTTREGRALSRYCDYLPQLRKIDAAHAARIEDGNFGR